MSQETLVLTTPMYIASSKTLIYQGENTLLNEMSTNLLGIYQSPKAFVQQLPLKKKYSESGTPVRVHLFIIQDNNQYYHASSSKVNLEIEQEHLLDKESGEELYQTVAEKASFYCRKKEPSIQRQVFYFAIPID